MKLTQLKYAVEIAKVGSLSKAAENLYIGQPNLSRAIKELETSLGIVIFKRSAKGMIPTKQGEDFLRRAKKVLQELEAMEDLYRPSAAKTAKLSVAGPHLDELGFAFVEFSKTIGNKEEFELFYEVTDACQTIQRISEGTADLGFVQVDLSSSYALQEMMAQKALSCQKIASYDSMVICSVNHPLAEKQEVKREDLSDFVCLAYLDEFVPPFSKQEPENQWENLIKKRLIHLTDRSFLLELLSKDTKAYFIGAPMNPKSLEKYGLLQLPLSEEEKQQEVWLISEKGHKFTNEETAFLSLVNDLSSNEY